DADHYGPAAAGYRPGAGRSSGGRLSARRAGRPGGDLRGGEVHHARRNLGLLLLDPGRGGRPQCIAQARDGDAAHGRHGGCASGARLGAGQPRRAGRKSRRGDRKAGKAARREAADAARGGEACILCADGSRCGAGLRARVGGDCRELRPPGGTGRHGCLHREAGPTGPVTAATLASRSTAKTGTSSVLEPKSWRTPVTSTISLGAGISAAAARNSSMDPNGSAVPYVNPVGTLMSGRYGASLPDRNAVLLSNPSADSD